MKKEIFRDISFGSVSSIDISCLEVIFPLFRPCLYH